MKEMESSFEGTESVMRRLRLNRGLTIGEMLIAVLLISVVAAIGVPGFAKSRASASKASCLQNLHRLAEAKQQWVFDHPNAKPGPLRSDLEGVYISAWPTCPSGGEYAINPIGQPPTCTNGGAHRL